MVSVLGVPNVGKSSLVNYLLGVDLNIVTHKPQTTRNKINTILTIDRTEIVLVDTPGLHKSSKEINKRFNSQANDSIAGADVNLILIDLTFPILKQLTEIQESIQGELKKTWLVFTKTDLIPSSNELPLSMAMDKAKEIIPSIERYFSISTKTGDNVHELTGAICDEAQGGPHHYLKGEISNMNMRFFATEYIREQILNRLHQEVPYEIAVLVEDYQEYFDKTENCHVSKIMAAIIVNRPSQRAIVVGTKGSMIKEIGMNARKKVEAMTGGKVHMNLHVKVVPNWFKNNQILEQLGLPRATDSNRVWRQRG